MSQSDFVGDFLTVLRNASQARLEKVTTPSSNVAVKIVEILEKEGFIEGYKVFEEGVKKFLLGFTFSGGIELPFGEYTGGIVELTVAPDITRQYFQPEINNVINIYSPGTTTSVAQKSVKNLSLELSIGIYFNRKVVYVD